MNQVFEILKSTRESKGWNKSQMAKGLCSSQLYGQYESGKKQPGADFFIKWKEKFGFDLLSNNETKVSTKPEETTVSLLAKALDNISEANRALARVVEENQKAILTQVTTNTGYLIETKTDLGIVAAMQNAYHEYWAEHVPPKNQTPKQVMREIHNKAFASLERPKKGNN